MNPRHPHPPFRYPHHHGNHPTRPPGHRFPIPVPHPHHSHQNYGLNPPPPTPPHPNWQLHQQQGVHRHPHHHSHHHHPQDAHRHQHPHNYHHPHHYPRQSHPGVHQHDHHPQFHPQRNPHGYPFNTHPPHRLQGSQHDPVHQPGPHQGHAAQPGNTGSNPVRPRACPPPSSPFQGHHTPPGPKSGLPSPPPPCPHPPPFQPPPPHPVPPDPSGSVTLNPADHILQETDSSRNPAEAPVSPSRLLDGQIATSATSSDAVAVSMSEQSRGAGADHREASDSASIQKKAESPQASTFTANVGDSGSQPASKGSKKTRRKKKKKKQTETETESGKEKGEGEDEEMAELYRQKVLVEQEMQAEIMNTFPRLLDTIILFPPLRFNKMAVKVDRGRGMLVHHASGSSDIGCDRAEEDVRRCMETIRDVTGEVMCVVFNYSFDNYLEKKHPQPARHARGGDPSRETSPSHAHSKAEVAESMADCDLTVREGELSQDTQHADCCSKRRRRRKISPASDPGKTATAKEMKPTPTSQGALSRTHEGETAQNLHTDQASLRTSENKSGHSLQAEEEATLSSTFKCKADLQDEQASPRTNDCKRQHDLQQGQASPKRFSSHRPNSFKRPESPNKPPNNAKRKPAHSPDPPKPFLKAKSLFPNTDDLDKELKRGDFDVLVISPLHGCVIMENKSVGYNQKVAMDILKRKAQQAIDQLAKQEKVLRFLFKDLKENLPVSKVLALPNIARQQLRDLCLQDPQFAQALCSCCGVSSTEEALATALVADDLPSSPPPLPSSPQPPQSPPPCAPSHEALLRWWRHVTKGKHSGLSDADSDEEELQKEGDILGESVRRRMIARLAGPWSRVTVESTKRAAEARTVAECIHLTGLRYGRPLLRKDQLHVLDSEDPFVFLTGPPGSGKTLVLGLKGLQWARQGDHVVVFVPKGVGWGSLVSLTLYNRILDYATHTFTPTPHHHRSPSRRKRPSVHNNADNRTSSSERMASPHSQTTDEDDEDEEEDEEDTSEENSSRGSQVESSHVPNQNVQQASSCDPPNIHKAEIEKMEDTKKFVKDLLRKYNDRPLRILVDEGPTKVNEKYIHSLLNDALKALEQGVLQVRGLQERGGGGGEEQEGEEEGVSCGAHGVEEGRRECGCPLSSASPESLNKVKGMLQKVQHHLQTVSERMPVLQPPHGRPPLTQTKDWKCFISGIRTSHASLTDFTHTLHSQLSTLLTCHERSEGCGQFGADSSESSEDVLNAECTDGLLQNQGSVSDTSKLPRSVESAGNVSKPSENVASVCNASEDTHNCRSVEDVPNASKAMEDSSDPMTEDRLNSPGSTNNVPDIMREDKAAQTCHEAKGDAVVCGPQAHECGEIHQKTEDGLQTESRHSDTRQLQHSGQAEPRHSRMVTEPGCPQTPPPGEAASDEAAGEKDALPDSSSERNTSPSNQESEQARGTIVTEDTRKTPPCTETLQSLDVDEVLQVLDQLEAGMLEASGKLFNVENQMDFALISDVLSLLVKEQGRADLSVWSSAVTHFFQPPGFKLKSLPHCLRCPPTVQHVLSLVEKDLKDCPNYEYTTDSLQNSNFPLPTNGPEVCLMNHASHMTKVKDILDCWQCGQAMADYLLDTLHVGQEGSVRVEDVAISGSLDINHLDSRPFLTALTHRGLHMHYQSQGHDITPPPYPGRIFITGGCSFQGLESEVVVFIPDVSRIPQVNDLKEFRPELPAWLRGMGRWNRCHLWFVASRCLSQLVVFHV